MSKPISAHFDGVEDGARQIIKRAEGISSELQSFNKKVEEYVNTYGQGAANDAFAAFQANWNQMSEQLHATLVGAGQLVSSGNSELQGTDVALSNIF
ncbi:WXG100 family type VII secretion target [Nocardia australiensis]|uniref:WXG100 family type VII secretion target n=1 Tax=Nocardia australiensis TaxID=2887191 RepID=UPI001D13C268|nr:WXG100 family type VII secretion target [Nocardia australiensis]